MKNLMIYISPKKAFTGLDWGNEADILARVQIDNSIRLGWVRDDIWLVTNFPYEYRGVKALEIGDDAWCEHSPTASKINAIIALFERGLIEDNELYWFHDLDAFQLASIDEAEVGIGPSEIGVTDYGRSSLNRGRDKRWSTGTIFFRSGSLDIFKLLKVEMYRYKVNEEIMLLETLKKGKYGHIRDRVRKLNITYNLATRRRLVGEAYAMAEKPLRVIHFHPFDRRPLYNGEDNMSYCVHGRNEMGHPLVTKGLAGILESHGIR
jgi:hypothetical protein